MIICSFCGSGVEDYQGFCGECGTPNPAAPRPVTPISQASPRATATPSAPQSNFVPPVAPPPQTFTPPRAEYAPAPAAAAPPRRVNALLVALIGLVIAAAVAAVVYFALTPNKTIDVAASLKEKVRQGTLVAPSGAGDAYEDYSKLKSLDPQNPALAEMRGVVLTQLRALGDEVFRKKTRVDPTTSDVLTESDWTRTARVYQWAQELDPSDKHLGARRKFAEAEVAKIQAKRADDLNDMAVAESKRAEAESAYKSASDIDPAWAVPQNSLGLLIVENVGVNRPKERCHAAINYYKRAVQLDPNWEIPFNNMGTAYYILGPSYDADAESSYRRAVQINPAWARPHYWLGELYERKGDAWKSTALEEYQTAQRLGKDNLPVTPQQLESKIQKLQQWP